MPEDLRYRLAYEESVRALSDQLGSLSDLRSRAGILLSAASISTSFLGGIAVAGHGLGRLAWIAIGSFVLVAFLVSLVLLPTQWAFEVDVGELLADYVEASPPADLDEMHRSLAFYRQRHFDWNDARLAKLVLAYRVATVFLALEVLAWLIDFAVG